MSLIAQQKHIQNIIYDFMFYACKILQICFCGIFCTGFAGKNIFKIVPGGGGRTVVAESGEDLYGQYVRYWETTML